MRAVGVPEPRALGEDVGLVRRGFDRAAYHLFRVAQSVDGRGVDPVDAQIERAMNGGDGVVVVLRTPGVLPVAAADGPGAEADGSEMKIGVAEGAQCVRGSRLS